MLHGAHGSDQWNAGGNKAWPKFIELYRPIAKLAEDEDITITVENGFNAMIVSGYQCRKFIEALGCLALWLPQTRTLHPVALIAGSAALGILFHM